MNITDATSMVLQMFNQVGVENYWNIVPNSAMCSSWFDLQVNTTTDFEDKGSEYDGELWPVY